MIRFAVEIGSMEIWEDFATDLCTPTQNPNLAKELWHTSTNNSICMPRFVSGIGSSLT